MEEMSPNAPRTTVGSLPDGVAAAPRAGACPAARRDRRWRTNRWGGRGYRPGGVAAAARRHRREIALIPMVQLVQRDDVGAELDN